MLQNSKSIRNPSDKLIGNSKFRPAKSSYLGFTRKQLSSLFLNLITNGVASYALVLMYMYIRDREVLTTYLMLLSEHRVVGLFALVLGVFACGFLITIKLALCSFMWREIMDGAVFFEMRKKNGVLYRLSKILLNISCIIHLLKTPFAHIRKVIVAVALLFVVVVPNVSNSMADIDFSATQKVYIEDKIRNLTAQDVSITLLTYVFGSAIDSIKGNVLSLEYITQATASSGVSGGVLELDYAQVISPITTASDSVDKNDGSNEPDSPMGVMSLYVGEALLVLLVVASAYRFMTMYAIDAIDSIGDARSQTAMFKRLTMTGVSAGFSSLIATPIYKGYTILTLFLFHAVIIGVGFTNAMVMNYFEGAITASSPTPYVTDNGELVYANMVNKLICVKSAESSSQIVIPTDIKANIPDDGRAQVELIYSICGTLVISSQEDLIGSEKLGRQVYVNDGWDDEKIQDITEFIFDEYIGILNTMQTSITELVDSYMDVLGTYEFKEFTEICSHIKRTGVEEGGTFDWDKFTQWDSTNEWFDRCSMTNVNEAKSTEIKKKYREDMIKLRSQVVLLMSDRLGLDTDKDGTRKLEEYDSSDENSINIDDSSTYLHYSLGWVEFPYHLAYRDYISKRTINWLKFTIENPTENLKDVSDFALSDSLYAQTLVDFMDSISRERTQLNDARSSIEKADDLLGDDGFTVDNFLNFDAVASNYVAIKIADFFMVEPGESVISEFSSTGNLIINLYIGSKAVMGAVDNATGGLEGIFSKITGFGSGNAKSSAGQDDIKKAVQERLSGETSSKGFLAKAKAFVKKFNPVNIAKDLVIGGLMGAFDAYKTLIAPLLDYVMPFAIFCAYILPIITMFYFLSCALKWFLQVIKMSVLSSVAAIKVWANDGKDLLASGAKDVLMGAVATAVMPMIVIMLFVTIDNLLTPVSVFYQQLAYKVINITFADVAQGPLYIVLMVGALVIPTTYMIIYMLSFPSLIQDAIISFMSINLGISGAGGSMAATGAAMAAGSPLGNPLKKVGGGKDGDKGSDKGGDKGGGLGGGLGGAKGGDDKGGSGDVGGAASKPQHKSFAALAGQDRKGSAAKSMLSIVNSKGRL